jgi:hypothetical protein
MITASKITMRDLKRVMEKFKDERNWWVDFPPASRPVVFYSPAFYEFAKEHLGDGVDVRMQELIPMSTENPKNGG